MNTPAARSEEDLQRRIRDLVSLLDLETLDADLFRGASSNPDSLRVFGGQVIGQAMVAARRTAPPDRMPHSLHAYFLRGGDPRLPIIYEVMRDRDGKSFTSRRVIARQDGEPIFSLAISFHVREPGLHHQFEMPTAPPPEELKSHIDAGTQLLDRMSDARRQTWGEERSPIEFRPVDPVRSFSAEKAPPLQSYWIRAVVPLPDDQFFHRLVLAYASDIMLLATAMLPHGVHWLIPDVQYASLDHTIWFHDDVRADDWLLYIQDSPWVGGARGLVRGQIYSRGGKLLASVAQETLFRARA